MRRHPFPLPKLFLPGTTRSRSVTEQSAVTTTTTQFVSLCRIEGERETQRDQKRKVLFFAEAPYDYARWPNIILHRKLER